MNEFGDKLINLRTARQIESLGNFFEVESKVLADLAKLPGKV